MKIKKGDVVRVLAGKDRDKTGKVLRVFAKEGRVLIEGVNLVKKHVRKRGQTAGGMINLSKPINLSNAGLVCPHCQKVTRVGFQMTEESKARVCKKCGKEIKGAEIKR